MASRSLLRRCTTASAVLSNNSSSKTFSSAARSDKDLKSELKRGLKKEVALLAVMVAAGVTGVHFYKNRESAPVKKVERLIEQAKHCAKEKKLEQALICSRRAYKLVQDTNPHDRHLFELAFSIAAQFESLKSSMLALRYYLYALEHNSREPNVAKRDRNRVVTLDRIAQSYENMGYATTAEKYFEDAISVYDQNRGQRELSKATDNDAADLQALDQEISGTLYNYSRFLVKAKRWSKAENSLKRALILARISSLSNDYIELIEDALVKVRTEMVMNGAEQKDCTS
ncbi:putative tetratricopeptide-like helical domain superfamily [Plasmopara halstedii]